jgi:AraC-like DNA-binding protein
MLRLILSIGMRLTVTPILWRVLKILTTSRLILFAFAATRIAARMATQGRDARAAQMLSHGHANISEVCYATGFANLSYFAKCFKQQYGATPKEYHLSHTAASQGVRND